jgi:ankyrin repeat protein
MRNRYGFSFKPGVRSIKSIFIICTALTLSVISGCASGIHQSAETGDIKKIKALLKEDPSLIDEKDSYGMTALHWAVDKRHRGVAALLLEEGAHVNVKDKNGETPLHYAIAKEYRSMATMLMLKGAEIPGSAEEVRDMLTRIAPLHQAVRSDRLQDVEIFLKKFPDQVNARDNLGRTPLYWAARANSCEICEVLLSSGADVNAATHEGWTSLHTAIYNKKSEAAVLLLAKGADVNVKNRDGETPLHWAAKRGKKNLVEPLIAKGADVNAKDNNGKTPLDWAEDNDIIELLHRHGTGN